MSLKTSIRQRPALRKKGIVILLALTVLLSAGLVMVLHYHKLIFKSNVKTDPHANYVLYIPSNPTFEEVVGLLELSGTIESMKGFLWVARRKKYQEFPKGGRYILENGMSNNQLVNMLRSGRQAPLNVTFHNIRTLGELAGHLAIRLEPDSLQFLAAFNDKALLKTFDFEPQTLHGMILPDTYQMFWTTSAEGFLLRMHQEYVRFWNVERLNKADAVGLTPVEVATLASIVDEETIKEDEKPVVAGLYLNRLKMGMRLQADPTIKYVIGNFAVTRILTKDLQIDSPYNTYIYAGLPPGPIRIPSTSGIDAVLNHEKHNYIYMCAKEDFSGYHNFARTLQQHNRNAARYREELRKLRIYR